MKLKIMLAVLLTVGSVTTVSAETIGSAGFSARVTEMFNQNQNEVTVSRDLTEKFNELNGAVKDADVSIEKNDVVVVTSSMEEITDSDKEKDKTKDKANTKDKTSDVKVVKTDVKDLSKKVYVKKKVTVRELPTEDSDKIDIIAKGKKIEVTGKVGKWYRIQYKDGDAFVSSELCTENNPNAVIDTIQKIDYSEDTGWNGKKLTKSAGTIKGPSGKETYYNLNMNGVVRRLKRMGYSGDYWVREDGVKMFGNYVLVAAAFDIRPIGTILPTSLGMGLVADTGGFVRNNKYQLDIATNW